MKGSWTPAEDRIVIDFVRKNGPKQWALLAKELPGRMGKQCRERWKNCLDPNVKRTPWTREEDEKIIELHKEYGNRWTKIAQTLPGRTGDAIKNRWHATLAKRDAYPVSIKRKRPPKKRLESTCASFNQNPSAAEHDVTFRENIKNQVPFPPNTTLCDKSALLDTPAVNAGDPSAVVASAPQPVAASGLNAAHSNPKEGDITLDDDFPHLSFDSFF